MPGPLSNEDLTRGLSEHISKTIGDPNDPESVEGSRVIADAVVEYFAGSFRGAPPGGGRTLLWIIYSALLEGVVPQAAIDQFFTSVDTDPARLLKAWMEMGEGAREGKMTVALIPGDLSEQDIFAVAKALFANRPAAPL